MMVRVRVKRGDVFEVPVIDGEVSYFQYVADDSTQLNSEVIRVFRKRYESHNPPDLADLITSEVQFHAHTMLKVGLKFGFWKKHGNAAAPEEPDVLFRISEDFGNPAVKVSSRWHVWQTNRPLKYVGALTPEFQNSEIGVVKPPEEIVERMRTGEYSYFHPGY
jgi:hypothetical protein